PLPARLDVDAAAQAQGRLRPRRTPDGPDGGPRHRRSLPGLEGAGRAHHRRRMAGVARQQDRLSRRFSSLHLSGSPGVAWLRPRPNPGGFRMIRRIATLLALGLVAAVTATTAAASASSDTRVTPDAPNQAGYV